MSDATTEAPAAGAEAAAGTAPERPAWLADDPHGFWDGEKGEVKTESLYNSWQDTKKLIGARVGDLGIEARRKLAEVVPDAIKGTWAEEYRAKLAEDAEFLTPLEEAWKAKNLRQAPEAYEPPEVPAMLLPDSPLYAKATEFAKEQGFDQDTFSRFMTFVVEAQNDRELTLGGFTTEQFEAAVPDLVPRAVAVKNRLMSTLGAAFKGKLLEEVRTPESFLELEAYIKANGPKPMALEGITAPETLDKKTLDQMVLDPRYYSDDAFREKVTKGFSRLYNEHV